LPKSVTSQSIKSTNIIESRFKIWIWKTHFYFFSFCDHQKLNDDSTTLHMTLWAELIKNIDALLGISAHSCNFLKRKKDNQEFRNSVHGQRNVGYWRYHRDYASIYPPFTMKRLYCLFFFIYLCTRGKKRYPLKAEFSLVSH
jgi:hypothetical protein